MTSTPGTRVLVIDENAGVRRALTNALTAGPGACTVRAVDGAATALAEVEAWAPDLVLLEVKRGDGQGTRLCRAIAETGTPVLVITTYPDVLEELELGQRYAAGYLLKDANPGELLDAVARYARPSGSGQRSS